MWLGRDDEHTQAVSNSFSGLEKINTVGNGSACRSNRGTSADQCPNLYSFVGALAQNPQLFLPFERLMNRSWRAQTLTVQELTLPYTVEFLCGRSVIG